MQYFQIFCNFAKASGKFFRFRKKPERFFGFSETCFKISPILWNLTMFLWSHETFLTLYNGFCETFWSFFGFSETFLGSFLNLLNRNASLKDLSSISGNALWRFHKGFIEVTKYFQNFCNFEELHKKTFQASWKACRKLSILVELLWFFGWC